MEFYEVENNWRYFSGSMGLCALHSDVRKRMKCALERIGMLLLWFLRTEVFRRITIYKQRCLFGSNRKEMMKLKTLWSFVIMEQVFWGLEQFIAVFRKIKLKSSIEWKVKNTNSDRLTEVSIIRIFNTLNLNLWNLQQFCNTAIIL